MPGTTRAPLLKRFCSHPLPELDLVSNQEGALDFVRVEAPLGRENSDTLLIGELLRSVEPRYRKPGFDDNAIYIRMRTPCKAVVLDVFGHEDLFESARYEARLFSDLFTGELFTRHLEGDELMLNEKVEKPGSGIESIELPGMPNYREMLQFAFDRAGWDSERFDLHRISIDFPVTPTDLVLRNPLPERGRSH